ncbi:hypothetical protein G647_01975 [Cladophialophora carrionii CBS 160.54]|uniref:Protein SYS1 n=1 Tax=Cladophialophora carrionii CBS 160.54 TaxID=1279043 RepID=V9DU36_9EURO|nr:uncharacterized protein G647_01975 [Cladophialophora carrionii CBS 160.54]ETI29522.1 hypothetical protein G647_01975 [Cladophialophora carrionii CBS 160.54]
MPRPRRKPPRSGALTELPPLKILRSILVLQLWYYTTFFIFAVFVSLVLGQEFSPDLVLDWRSVRGDNTLGWTVGFLCVVNGFVTVIPILIFISRSKLVPDFALTLHFINLLVTSFYTGAIPTNLLWWGLEAASAALMIVTGVWACRYREMQPISFGTPATKKTVNPAGDPANGSAEPLMGNNGYEMGNIRGDDNV